MFIREVEEELFDEDIGEFLHCGDRQRGEVALSSLSADDITKLFERQISASSRGRGLRSSSSEGNLEPFKLNDRVSSRRLRASSKQRRLSGGIESKAREEEEEKKKKEGGLTEITLHLDTRRLILGDFIIHLAAFLNRPYFFGPFIFLTYLPKSFGKPCFVLKCPRTSVLWHGQTQKNITVYKHVFFFSTT